MIKYQHQQHHHHSSATRPPSAPNGLACSSDNASLGGSPSYSALYTASHIGISTPSLSLSTLTLFAVATPSATAFVPPLISSKVIPLANLLPTLKFRLRLDEHVSMRSPTPARPAIARPFDPHATARRVSSARPRHTSAARALLPNSSPSSAPDAMARTFLTAPEISMPATSSDTYARREEPSETYRATRSATSADTDATTTFVGCPSMISLAKDGPARTAKCL
mmetsp:Transcript_12821/g.31286  ORF Transcript_12821/g.31286 Transcript_12821/m.31286 type:complete len:224 (-) Transcript_12821:555-1226(-)